MVSNAILAHQKVTYRETLLVAKEEREREENMVIVLKKTKLLILNVHFTLFLLLRWVGTEINDISEPPKH